MLYGNETSVHFILGLWWFTRGTGASRLSSENVVPELEEAIALRDQLERCCMIPMSLRCSQSSIRLNYVVRTFVSSSNLWARMLPSSIVIYRRPRRWGWSATVTQSTTSDPIRKTAPPSLVTFERWISFGQTKKRSQSSVGAPMPKERTEVGWNVKSLDITGTFLHRG